MLEKLAKGTRVNVKGFGPGTVFLHHPEPAPAFPDDPCRIVFVAFDHDAENKRVIPVPTDYFEVTVMDKDNDND